ncbi:unnamed protein product [Spirodela intermedia]|uniref:Uncharacterized protein n=1 Tax=Spirodela intermedia TaxID=51605 RepID=A0A7I8IU19_SPIIN|nr:unnamed protein product [Spirodela intermedia]CAA6660628.1 unnamed protein product [Spirodela intermedia]
MESSPVLSSPARRLEGKVAIVTGGASGIGESTARLFARHGAKVIIADIQDEMGQEVCREIVGDGGMASYVHCDVSSEADVQAAVETNLRSHGRLDVMFNNADTAEEYRPHLGFDRSGFEKVFAVNVIGVFLGIKHAGRAMASTGLGSIINTASTVSVMTMGVLPTGPRRGGLTRDAAVELGRCGVRVNCVSPHLLASPLACRALGMDTRAMEDAVEKSSVLSAAALKAQDIAEAVLYLASDESRYVNGHNLVVDGGYTTTNPSLGAHLLASS